MKIIVVYDLPREGFKALCDAGHKVIFPDGTTFSEQDLFALLPNADVVVTVFTLPFSQKHIEAAPKLKLIANYGVGYNLIDLDSANKQNITVTNTPDPVIEPTAELAMALMLTLTRRITQLDKQIRVKDGLKWGIMENLGDSLEGKTLGIIGMGNIGRSLARRAAAHRMTITYHNRTQLDQATEARYNATYVELNTLIKQSDYISLNAPYTKETHHILGEKEFKLMKDTAYIINTARGPLIDEAALVNALKKEHIKGAGMDVFENEPDIHPGLMDLDKVIMLPHVGTGTYDTRIELGKSVSKNILNFISGKGDMDKVN